MESETLRALENLRLRLLDLTARNRLINFRHTKKGSLRIIDELPKQLVETLLTENEMRFRPVPEPTRCKSSKDLGQTSWKVKRDFYVL